MPGFCLLPKQVEEFKARIKTGELNPDDLMAMTSAERHAKFASFLGESNAQPVNAMFESKLLLKHQQEGIIAWAQRVGGLKPEVQRDILARVNRMDRVLEPKELDAFLSDLAAQKLGFGVTMEEAGKISELAKATSEAKAAMETGGDRLEYGAAKVSFSRYVSDLRNEVKHPTSASDLLRNTAGLAKSLKASGDNSALFRQGWKTLFSHPEIWQKNARQSWVDIAQTLGGKEVLDAVDADVFSRPNALNGRYAKAKLALGNIEEAFPTSLPEKVPILGRVYKAGEAAYTGFLRRTRADVFDKYMDIAEKSGVELSDPAELQSIGKLVNSLTGRGDLGKVEGAADVVNVTFFSLRNFKSNVDFLTAHQGQAGVTPFVRKQAALNLAKTVAGTAAILAIADAVAPGSVEWNPQSSDFGKIKVKDTRFDVTAGMGSIAVLAARMVTGAKKNATNGKVTKLDGSVMGQNRWDMVVNFFENKLSPAASLVKDLMKGRDFDGNTPTITSEADNLGTPLPIATTRDNVQHYGADELLVYIAAALDFVGIGAQTFTDKKKKGKP
ncbi:MAG: hypothetical protein JWL61_5006 [Gemmatimonadetes bacterium]|nr:hypothetical protein [Gemmatimonadota bacterium]